MSRRERTLREKISRELKVYAELYQEAETYEDSQDLLEQLYQGSPNSKSQITETVEEYIEFQKRILSLRDVYERVSTYLDDYRQLPDSQQNPSFLKGLEAQVIEMEKFRDHSTDNLLGILQTTLINWLTAVNESKKHG